MSGVNNSNPYNSNPYMGNYVPELDEPDAVFIPVGQIDVGPDLPAAPQQLPGQVLLPEAAQQAAPPPSLGDPSSSTGAPTD